jgi:ABC-type nitrate/sulfonate/bicarbonate transport system substrate-binding protein
LVIAKRYVAFQASTEIKTQAAGRQTPDAINSHAAHGAARSIGHSLWCQHHVIAKIGTARPLPAVAAANRQKEYFSGGAYIRGND